MTDIVEQADEIERLRAERDRAIKTTSAFALDVAAKDTEIERLRAALRECRKMVGHPDNMAFINAALGDEQLEKGST